MQKATPSTPPQDPTPAQPADPGTPTETDPKDPGPTPEPSKPADTEPPKQEDPQPAMDVDYKQQYRSMAENYRKLQAAHDTLKGKYNKAEQEKKDLKQQLEDGPVKPQYGLADSVRETDAYKRVQKEWDDETAEDFVNIAAHMVSQVQTPKQPAPADPVATPASEPDDPFFVSLDQRLPGWDVNYNDNPEFISWIQSNFEPFSGETYQSLLERSQATSDVEAALRIFSAFDRSRVSQNTDTTPDSYIEPANVGGEGPTQPEAPTFEADYLSQQERLLQRKKISREEFYKRRNEFIKANNEGRVKAA